jgi:hypothetical protein
MATYYFPTWDNFQGKVEQESPYDAFTRWSIKYSWKWYTNDDGRIVVTVDSSCTLNPDSWCRTDKMADRLLRHEGFHYLIGCLCNEDWKYQVANKVDWDSGNVESEVHGLFKTILTQYQEWEKVYDLETNHYHNVDKQAEWENDIMDKLAAYGATIIS